MARFKYLMAILLTIISTSAIAEWSFIEVGAMGEKNDYYFFYADKDTIRKKGNIARMWSLDDFESPQKGSFGTYLSTVQYHEFDCIEEKISLLSTIYYSKNMREGVIVNNFNIEDKKWNYIVPGTMGEIKWKTACGK
jgi:hypothetical protein